MDAVIKAQEFVCQTHREYLEKCGWSIEECGVEACFAYLYTQGIIDEDYERVVELENQLECKTLTELIESGSYEERVDGEQFFYVINSPKGKIEILGTKENGFAHAVKCNQNIVSYMGGYENDLDRKVQIGDYVYVQSEEIPSYMFANSGQPKEFVIAGRWYAYNIFSHTLSVCPPEFDISKV